MPCGDGSHFYRNDPELTQQLDRLTRRLCSACALLESHNVAMPNELDAWWTKHKLADQHRLDREAQARAEEQNRKSRQEYLQSVKERLLPQLSPDEREALGLK